MIGQGIDFGNLLISVFVTLGWQVFVFGRNLAADWLLDKDGSSKKRKQLEPLLLACPIRIGEQKPSKEDYYVSEHPRITQLDLILYRQYSVYCRSSATLLSFSHTATIHTFFNPFSFQPVYFTWYFVIGAYNIPLNILCFMNIYVPVREFLVSEK